MKVLWTHNFNPNIPGAGSFMYTLAAGMKKAGVLVDFHYLGQLNRPIQLWKARAEVRRLSSSYDLVHAQFGSACSLASTSSVAPTIVSLRGSDWHRYKGPDRAERLHSGLAVLFTRLSLPTFTAIITMSNRMSAEVKAISRRSPTYTIPDAIDTSMFRPMERQQARAALNVHGDNAPWVLFTSLFESNPVKRVALAKAVVQKASEKIPGLKLMVASGLPHEEMPKFVASCNVALCTSTHEGWPNSLKEALACNLPFVSTDVSDMSEIASRRSSCKVGPADIDALAQLLVDSLTQAPDLGLTSEVAGMSLELTCQHLARTYQAVIGNAESR